MKRSAFVCGGLAAALPRRARAADLNELVAKAAADSSGVVGVYARSMTNGPPAVLFNADEVFPAASVIKLLILATLYQMAEFHHGYLTQMVRLRASDMVGGSDYLATASPGQKFSASTLARAMITLSDNTASNALITLLGFDRINATARRMGLANTQLKRHFLDYTAIVHRSQNLTSAHDMGALMFHLERGAREAVYTIASPRSCRAMIDILLNQTDRDKIPRVLPPRTPVANKTGEIDGVRNDVAIVDPFGDSPYVLAVLTKELGDFSRGNHAIRMIAKAVNAELAE